MNVSSYREYQRELYGNGKFPSSITLLGARRRLLAVSVLAIGLVTIFVPPIGTDPPVIGTSKWSLWSVGCGIHKHTLPGPPNTNFIVVLGSLYAIMLVDLIGLCATTLFSVTKIQTTIALIGVWLSCVARYSHLGEKNWKLESLFYGESSGHVTLSHLTTRLIVVMAALLLICLDAMLDAE